MRAQARSISAERSGVTAGTDEAGLNLAERVYRRLKAEMDEFRRRAAAELGIAIDEAVPANEPSDRNQLRAELDVLVARDLFGLSRDEMRYLLEPADILGPDCGFETFGALDRAERREFGSFATRDRILGTWDALPAAAVTQR
jgi:hypothetical protein